MPRQNPYASGGDPNHPGVLGGPYGKAPVAANQDVMPARVDPLGTGTFPPEAQGSVGRAQPAGLSAMTQYGKASPGVVPGESALASPETHPLPTEAEGDAVAGLAPEHQTRETLLADKEERIQAQLDQIREQRSAQSAKPESDSGNNKPYDPNAIPEDSEEDDEESEEG